MPNHIQNILNIGGVSTKRIAEIRRAIRSKDDDENNGVSEIDFQKILPRPKELDITSGGWGDLALQAIHGVNPNKYFPISDKEAKERFKKLSKKDQAEAKKLGDLYFENIKKYGSKDWYDWSVENWGTKWNAYSTFANDETDKEGNITTYSNTINFQTAWSTPEPIIRKLSEMFPDASFHMTFADEDIGSNCGRYTYKNGEGNFDIPDDSSDEAMQVAMEAWGSEEDYIKLDGKWRYADDLTEKQLARAQKQLHNQILKDQRDADKKKAKVKKAKAK